MNDLTRAALRQSLKIAIAMLPRFLRHDLWRQCEPQHQRAEENVVERLVETIDFGFEVGRKPPTTKDTSAANLYRGPGERSE